jgi:hypothetical protein
MRLSSKQGLMGVRLPSEVQNKMLSWRNWITHLTTNQKIESSTLSGGTNLKQII